MDTTQFLLTVILTVTTLLMVIIGIQLIFVLKELRKTIKKISIFVDDIEEAELKNDLPDHKKQTIRKKGAVLHSLMDRIKFLSPNISLKTKKFFVKEKR